jgi:hypothetical protein
MGARSDLLLAGSDSCIQRGALSVPRKRFKEQRFHSGFFRDEKISGCLCRIAKKKLKLRDSSLCAEWYIDSFSNAVDRAPTVLRLAAAVAIEASR